MERSNLGDAGAKAPIAKPSGSAVPAVARAMAVMRHVAEAGDGNLADIVRATGLNKSTTYYLIRALVDVELLMYLPGTRTYVLGPSLIELASAARGQVDPLHIARRYLSQYVDDWGVTISFTRVNEAGQMILIDRIEKTHGARISLPLGSVVPWNGSAGRAYLSYTSADEVENVIAAGLTGYTASTMTDADEFREEIKRTRERGWAIDIDGISLGLTTIAAPIFGERPGAPMLIANAMAMSGTLRDDHIAEYGAMLRRSSDDISALLGVRGSAA